ncbi:MAG: beta-class carbonic anhydrase [Kineosporiaceae bacterium]
MSVTDDLLANARRYAATYPGGGPHAPAKPVVLVTCMDARFVPGLVFGLHEGDAHVLRNAGGVVTDDVIRSVAVSQHRLGTREILLVHHTDCGMRTFSDEEFAAQLEELAGRRPDWSARTIRDTDEAVRQSLRRLRGSPFLRHRDHVRGFVWDVHTADLREVVVP